MAFRTTSAVIVLLTFGAIASAHNSYTGGYSGAPGMRSCALSCHGSSSGTLTVSGFPGSYLPGMTYRITVAHNGGSPIVNFNATTRIGSTSAVAGSFTPTLNSTSYSGADGGVYASPHSIDSAVFQWTAPSAGTGSVTLYAAGFQGSTSSSSGQSRALAITSTEITTGVESGSSQPDQFALRQNYPNPFNPSTTISFHLPAAQEGVTAVSMVTLRIYDALGKEVETLVNEESTAGSYSVRWNASGMPSGVYFYTIRAGTMVETRRMILLR